MYDGVIMEHIIVVDCGLETKVGVQVLRDSIAHETSSIFDNNISDILEHISSTMTNVSDLGKAHCNLMKVIQHLDRYAQHRVPSAFLFG